MRDSNRFLRQSDESGKYNTIDNNIMINADNSKEKSICTLHVYVQFDFFLNLDFLLKRTPL